MDHRRRRELTAGTARTFHGLPVVMHRAERAHTEACLRKVSGALDLLAAHAPEDLAATRERFTQIFVWNGLLAAVGCYSPTDRLCELDCEYVERDTTSAAEVALTLVHEATHAELHAPGADREMSVAQEEWLCINAELAVAKHLPDAAALVADATQRRDRPAAFYTPRARDERRWAELEATAPNALMAALVRYAARRAASRDTRSTVPEAEASRSDARAG